MCITCFKNEVETEVHKKDHSYRIVGDLQTKIENNWSVLDYLVYLNSLVSCGINNNVDIMNNVQTKSQKEIRQKFFELSEFTNNTQNERDRTVNAEKSEPYDPVFLHFMPIRKDFEIELHNDYETYLQHTEINYDTDNEATKLLKKHMLNYAKVINKQRQNWRNFVFEKDLTKMEELQIKDQNIYGLFISKYKWLAQFLSKDDFNKVLSCFFKEECMKKTCRESYEKQLENLKNFDYKTILSFEEKLVCQKLRLDLENYVKLKRYALETFIAKKQLKQIFFQLFSKNDCLRAEMLYNWFYRNGIVFE